MNVSDEITNTIQLWQGLNTPVNTVNIETLRKGYGQF